MSFLVIIGVIGLFGLLILAIGVAAHYSKVEKQLENGTYQKGIKQDGADKNVSGVLLEAKVKVKDIRNQAIREKDISIRSAIEEIVHKSEEILKEIHRDPDDAKKARKFLNYYLDATVNVLNQYTLLKSKNIDKHKTVLDKVLPLLKDIKTGLVYEYNKLFEKELMDLDVEIEVLRKTLEQDLKIK